MAITSPIEPEFEKEIASLKQDLNTARLTIIKLECERNALIQALRIVASSGVVDVVKSS